MAIVKPILKINRDGTSWKNLREALAEKNIDGIRRIFITADGNTSAKINLSKSDTGDDWIEVYDDKLVKCEFTVWDDNGKIKPILRINRDGSKTSWKNLREDLAEKNIDGIRRIFITADGNTSAKINLSQTNAGDDWIKVYDNKLVKGEFTFTVTKPEEPEKPDSGKILPLNSDGTVTLPGGKTAKVKNDRLVESIYGNQFIRSDKAGTFEATARGKRSNGIVQGYVVIPQGMVGMKPRGNDEATILLKDNHGPGSKNKEDKQYKVFYEYKKGGAVERIKLGREHKHPTTEELTDVEYENQPDLEAGQKLEFRASYQDTNDGGVRLRMDWRERQSGQWRRLFDHVDYGDGNRDKCYRGESGVQDGIRVDGSVNEEIKEDKDVEPLDSIKGKPIGTTNLTSDQKRILSKLASGDIWAREIDPDNSNLKDGTDDPLSFGPKN